MSVAHKLFHLTFRPGLTMMLFVISGLSAGSDINKVTIQTPMTLNILVWEGYAPDSWIRKFQSFFQKKTGNSLLVKVNHAEEYSDFFNGIRAGRADIISIPSNMVLSKKFGFIDKKLIIPLRIRNIPNYKHILTPLLKSEYASRSGKVYGVPVAHGPYGLAYNTEKMPHPPQSWKVLWKEDYKKKYVISADQFEANIYITALANGISRKNMSHFHKIFSKQFESQLAQLSAHARNQWTAVDTAEDLQGAVLATSWGDSFNALRKLGEKWRFADPVEGTTGWLDYLLITKNAMSSDNLRLAAESWLNYAISAEFQAYHIVRELGNDPTSLAARSLLSPSEIEKHHLNDLSYFNVKRILWPVLEIRDLNGFETMWKRARSSTAGNH